MSESTMTKEAEAREIIAEVVAKEIKALREQVQKFTDRLHKGAAHPAFVLEGADDAFKAAAKLQVWEHLATLPLDDALTVASREAIRGARWLQQSTSITANLINRYKTAAYAEFTTHWEWLQANRKGSR